MIVSDAHKYVFVELPHTGSWAVREQLIRHYDGQSILRKHSTYREFLRHASPAQRGYFAFSSIRHPMDDVVSMFFKLKTDHKGQYSDAALRKSAGGWVTDRHVRQFEFITQRSASFSEYFRKFYRFPYDNWSRLDHGRLDKVMRFERLSEEFSAVLEALGLKQVEPLPTTNKTNDRRKSYWEYFDLAVRRHAIWVFSPFMRRWEYFFPESWGHINTPRSPFLLDRILAPIRRRQWDVGHS